MLGALENEVEPMENALSTANPHESLALLSCLPAPPGFESVAAGRAGASDASVVGAAIASVLELSDESSCNTDNEWRVFGLGDFEKLATVRATG